MNIKQIKDLIGQVTAGLRGLENVSWETYVEEIDGEVEAMKAALTDLEDRITAQDSELDEEPLPVEAMDTLAILTETLKQGNKELAQGREWLEKWCKSS
jgi:uncharacterized phage infection (PIP) family protein YhgE